VSFDCGIRRRGAKTPYLDCPGEEVSTVVASSRQAPVPVQASAGERVGILGVDGEAHDVVRMTLEDTNALPALLPVP